MIEQRPRFRWPGSIAAALAALLAVGSAFAQDTLVALGVEADDEGGYVVFSNIAGDFTEQTAWEVGLSHADSSSDFSALTTTAYDGSIRHDFGGLGLRIGMGFWDDSGVVDTERLTMAVDFGGEGWSVALEAERRDSDFDPLAVSTTIVRRNGASLAVNAVADCDLEDTGLGARVNFSNDDWSFGISGMGYDYDDTECAFDSPALQLLNRATREEFVQLAATLTRSFSAGAGARVLARTSFLDSRIGTSLTYRGAMRSYNVAYDHVKDAFYGTNANTLSGGVGFPLRSGQELEVYAGVTDSDELGSIGFLGFLAFLGL